MSGWDWIHAGLELATFTQALKAQQSLAEMKNAAQIEAARRVLLEAMRNFIFDISRDIQLAEEQITSFPQYVYIVGLLLNWRLVKSGLSTEVFPEFSDKEYVLKTQKKVSDTIEKSKTNLTSEQIHQSDKAVQYLIELPTLRQLISATSAIESIKKTEEEWKEISSDHSKKQNYLILGFIGLAVSFCYVGPLFLGALSGNTSDANSVFTVMLLLIIPIGSIVSIVLGGKSTPGYLDIKNERENWSRQLMKHNDWLNAVSLFGDLSSDQYQKQYQERLIYLKQVLGEAFHDFVPSEV